MKSSRILALSTLLPVMLPAAAQLSPPLDCTASAGIFGPDVALLLQGTSPSAHLAGLTPVPGALIHLLSSGPNGVADMPQANGQPGGDDIRLAEMRVGDGMPPDNAQPGMFSVSVPRPGGQTKLYFRAFNAPALADATHCGQSALFAPSGLEVMDASRLGLLSTTLRLGVDWATTDSDGDGVSDLDEWRANTNPASVADLLRIIAAGPGMSIKGQPGRKYSLQRSFDELSSPMQWQTLWTSPVLTAPQDLVLQDGTAQGAALTRAYYRVIVEMP